MPQEADRLTHEWREEVLRRLNKIDVELDKIKSTMSLSVAVTEVEMRVRQLERERDQTAGGIKVAMILAGFGGALVGWIINVVTKKLGL